jgi:TonB-linked SusC/RagA family outer membrane protein
MKRLLIIMTCVILTAQVSAQERTVTGKVTSGDDGLPLPGVNVQVKGTTTGTVTDAEGKYAIQIPANGSALIFSFIGYRSVTIPVEQKAIIDVPLTTDVTQLSEVVVTGTGVPVEKRKLSFAVESVTADKLPVVPTASIDQALIGKIPGAQISSIDGTPGAEMSILLRGINTINRGTMPMILVDGVQMGATLLSSIDINSIERVEVIQGAAAATIYGAQGANGVIQLFTKKGKSGKIKVDVSAGWAESELLNVGGLRKAKYHPFLTNANGEVINPGNGQVLVQNPETLLFNGNVGEDLLNPNSIADKPYSENCCRRHTQLYYYDHIKSFFRPANLYSASVSVSGGGEKNDFNISISKAHHQSNFRGDGYNERTNFSSNAGFELMNGLRLRSITQLIYNKNTINIWQKQDFGLGDNSFTLFQTRPFANLEKKDVDGNYGFTYGFATGANQFNPFYEYQYAATLDSKIDLLQNLTLLYTPAKFLETEILYGINYQDKTVNHTVKNQSENRNSMATGRWTGWRNPISNEGEITTIESTRTFKNLKARATLRFDLQNDFNLHLPLKLGTDLVFDYRSDKLHRYSSAAFGMSLIPPLVATNGSAFSVYEDYREDFVTYGYLVNQRIEYDELAGVSGGFRTDYSSAFGRGSSPFTFPRADAFLRVSGFNFWDKSFLSKSIIEWKVRAAYGAAGIQPRPFDRFITLTPRTLGDSRALYVGNTYSNPDLTVEISKEFEAGTDLTVDGLRGNWLQNFNLSMTWWRRTTENSIFRIDVPPSQGFGAIIDNAVSLESNGYQISLNTRMLKNVNWHWNMTTNLSNQSTMITAVKGEQIFAFNRVLRPGEKIGQVFGAIMLKQVDQLNPNGEPFIDPLEQDKYEVASNGWVVNKLSRQPFISSERYSLGDPNPDFLMSVIQDVQFKRIISFSLQVDWVHGAKLYNNTRQWMYRDGIHSDYEKPITINDTTAAWTAFYRGAYTPTPIWEKNYFYEDASFVRLRNVAIAFDLTSIIKPVVFKKIQLVLTGRNLWTWTPYSGLDPEISTYGANNMFTSTVLSRGVDDNTLGNFKSYQVTINITL